VQAPHADEIRWEIAADPDEVHALLCECDAYTATARAPAPTRSFATTRRFVEESAVQVLRCGGDAIAMFTLTFAPPFSEDFSVYPPVRKPAYITRLAVDPAWLSRGTLVGARCVRAACDLAVRAGADVLRSEANPDLQAVRALLEAFGFEQYGPVFDDGTRRRVYMQKKL